MRTKDFIYYASAAVLLAVTTQVAHADEVATQTPSVTEGNQYQPATAAEIFGGEAALPATPSSTVSAPVATRWQNLVLLRYLRHLHQKVQRL